MDDHTYTVELIKASLSFPAVCLLGIILVIIYFRKTLIAVMENIKRVEIGNSVIQVSEPPGESGKKTPIPLPPDPAIAEPSTGENAYRQMAYLWEYRYLNLFLVPRTQIVLDWFYDNTSNVNPTNIHAVDAFWLPLISDPKERVTIIAALENHHLIQGNNDALFITPKGKEYVEWRGRRLPKAKDL